MGIKLQVLYIFIDFMQNWSHHIHIKVWLLWRVLPNDKEKLLGINYLAEQIFLKIFDTFIVFDVLEECYIIFINIKLFHVFEVFEWFHIQRPYIAIHFFDNSLIELWIHPWNITRESFGSQKVLFDTNLDNWIVLNSFLLSQFKIIQTIVFQQDQSNFG